jgi:hypothetical protein
MVYEADDGLGPTQASLNEEIRNLRLANARYASMIYSIIKRHPDATNWNLELEGVGQDMLPDEVFVGWNVVGEDAILTVLHGESLKNMQIAAQVAMEEMEEDED